MQAGIRDLRDNLSRYIREVEGGERVFVTAHGRVVAVLGPASSSRAENVAEMERLVSSGVITPPSETGDPLQNWPRIRLSPGSTAALIDAGREDRPPMFYPARSPFRNL